MCACVVFHAIVVLRLNHRVDIHWPLSSKSEKVDLRCIRHLYFMALLKCLTCVQISSLIFKCTHTLCANFGLDKHSLGNSMILDHVHLARCTLQWTRVTRWTKFTGVGPALYRFFPGTVTLCPGSKNTWTENLLPGTKNLFLGTKNLFHGTKNLFLGTAAFAIKHCA